MNVTIPQTTTTPRLRPRLRTDNWIAMGGLLVGGIIGVTFTVRMGHTQEGISTVQPAPMPRRAAAPVEHQALIESASRSLPVVLPIASPPRLIIPEIAVDAPIILPANADLQVLNDGLTQGVVHYPGSALPDSSEGNIFLFGHSTGYKVVRNKAYAIFNRLSELEPNDVIRIRYAEYEYWYRVRSIRVKKASEAWVDLRPHHGGRLLTLSTCRIFGAKDDRYVVEAEFMKSYPLQAASGQEAVDTSS